MSIIADAPEGYQEWPDIRSIHSGGGLIMPDTVAHAIAAASGRHLLVRVEQPGRGPRIYVHPDLLTAVEGWYRALPASIGAACVALKISNESSTSLVERRGTENTVMEGESCAPCSLFDWCDGHEPTCPESDGVHMTTIGVGQYAGGEPKYLYAIYYLPVEEDDEPAHWSFSMPEGGEWSFGPDDVDAEIQEGIDELLIARDAIKTFLLTAVTS